MSESARLIGEGRIGCSAASEEGALCAARRGEEPAPATADRAAWPGLSWLDRAVIAAALAVVAVVTVPRLPPGICFDDFGDLQLASDTLGIMHPTGYPGYVTLGYLITRIPGVQPAYLVSLACLASGIIALWLCIVMQVRLGVSAWVASAWGLVLAAHPKVWINLLAPEVYAPSLAFVAAAAYHLTRYAGVGRRRDLFVAALLYGVALANRPPVLFVLPLILIAWLPARRRWEATWRRSLASLALAAVCAILPVVYSVAFLWLRDRPDATYNYIEQYNAQWQVMPDVDAGWKAKIERVAWHMSGQQFKKFMGNTWAGVRSKMVWLGHMVFAYGHETMLLLIVLALALGLLVTFRRSKWTMCVLGGGLIASLAGLALRRQEGYVLDPLPEAIALVTQGGMGLLVAWGLFVTFRRCAPAAWALLGMMAASTAFVLAYRVTGQSADILPLLFAGTVLSGRGVSSLLGRFDGRVRQIMGIGFMLVMCVTTVADSAKRHDMGAEADATSFVAKLDMSTLPQNAVICTGWRAWPPLRYAQYVLTGRSDILIINADPTKWLWMIEGKTDREVFFTHEYLNREGITLTPYRNLWRLEWTEGSGRPLTD